MIYKAKIKIILENDDDIEKGELISVTCYDIIGDLSEVRIKYYSDRAFKITDIKTSFDKYSTVPVAVFNTFFKELEEK